MTGVRRIGRAIVLALVLCVLGPLAGARPGPPPTPVPPRGSPSPFLQRLDVERPGANPPHVGAAAAVLLDRGSGQVLYEKRGRSRRPIASLTKVMTALLVLERAQVGDLVTVSARAVRAASIPGAARLGLQVRERITVEDLLYALLLQSANDAAVVLAEHLGGTVSQFVRDMNRRAALLGMRDTRFRSPSGLNDRGYSTALDLARLTEVALEEPVFASIVATKFRTIDSPSGPPRRIQNRNVLLWLYPGATGVKTGYTARARYNVIASARRGERELIAVVLGDPGEAFSDAADLLNYGFGGFEEKVLLSAGERVGTATLYRTEVGLAARESVTALVPAAERLRLERDVILDPAALPVEGRRVGVVRVLGPEGELGRAPLVVAIVERRPEPPEGSWVTRTLGALARGVGAALQAVFG